MLLSNFSDYYDHWFDPMSEHTLRRYTYDGMDRFAQLRFLERCGLRTPAYGTVAQLLSPHSPRLSKNCHKLVVYTDVHAHCGEGKLLLDRDQALSEYPECLASEYIGDCPNTSWRYLQVGMHGFWIEYKSNFDWRSNCGDLITMQVIGTAEGWCSHPEAPGAIICKLPLFAIDFVIADHLYAVDFNVAPGIRGSGVESLLPPKHAVASIKAAYFGGTYAEDVHRYYV